MGTAPPKDPGKKRESNYTCLFPGCDNYKPYRSNNNDIQSANVDKVFHKFPKDCTAREIWLQICSDESKPKPSNKRLWVVCGDHFSKLDYKYPVKRRNLKPDAIPKPVYEVNKINSTPEKKSVADKEVTVVKEEQPQALVYTYYGPNSVQMQDGASADEFVDLETDKAFIITKPNVSLLTTAGYMTKDDGSVLLTESNISSHISNNVSTLDSSISDLNTDAIMTDINSATGVDTMSTDVDTLATDVESMATTDCETEETVETATFPTVTSTDNCFDTDIVSNLSIPSSSDLVTDLNTIKASNSTGVPLGTALNSLVTNYDPLQLDSKARPLLPNGLGGKVTKKLLKISREDALKCGALSSDDIKLSQPIPKCIRIANTEENLNILQFPKNVNVDQKKNFIEITPPKKYIKLDRNLLKKTSTIKFDGALMSFEKLNNTNKFDSLNNCNGNQILNSSDSTSLLNESNTKTNEMRKSQNPASFIENYCTFLTGIKDKNGDLVCSDSTEETSVPDRKTFMTDLLQERQRLNRNTATSEKSSILANNENCKSIKSQSNVIVNSVKIVNPPIVNQNVVNNQISSGTQSETSSHFDKSEVTVKLSENSDEDDENDYSESNSDSSSEPTFANNKRRSVTPYQQKQIRILKFQNSKLKRLLTKERDQLKSLRKLYVRKHYEFMDEHLPKVNRDFINCQLRNFRNTTEHNFNENDIAFAFQLYQHSRDLYNYLSTVFALPPREIFLQLFTSHEFAAEDLEMMEGVNPQVLENLRLRTSQMLQQDRVCSLLFAEVSFEDLTATVNKVLIFMVRGVQKDFQQIVAYFTYQEPDMVAPEALQDVIKGIVTSLLEFGLRVVALITNFSEFSYKVFNRLNNSENIEQLQLPIVINDVVLYPIFNAPNLLINLLDLFRVHNIYFTTDETSTQYKIAQYSHLLAAFNHDCLRRYPILSGLTLADFTSNSNPCSSISTAVRQFSYSMANALENYALNNLLYRDALSTAEFIEIIDKLFDSVNTHTPTVNAKKPLTQLLTADSEHLTFWQQMLDILRYWQIGDTSSADLNNTLFGWQITIASIVGIWEQVQRMEIKQMALRKLNLEPLEAAINNIYLNEQFVANPTLEHFINGMRGVIVDNMLLPIVAEE